MLDRQDLDMIRSIMKEEIGEGFAEQEEQIAARFAEQEKGIAARFTEHKIQMEAHLALRFAASENMVLSELDRIHINLQSQINHLSGKLEELTEYYRIKKLDDVNQELLLQMIQEVERRVEVLERKSA